MLRKRQQEGYLTVDHRASPGIPEDLARALGYDPKVVGEGKFFEAATLTCRHCRNAVVKNPLRTRERHSCFKCGDPAPFICDGCAYLSTLPGYDHTPFERVIDMHLDAAAKGRQFIDPNATLQLMGTPLKLLLP